MLTSVTRLIDEISPPMLPKTLLAVLAVIGQSLFHCTAAGNFRAGAVGLVRTFSSDLCPLVVSLSQILAKTRNLQLYCEFMNLCGHPSPVRTKCEFISPAHSFLTEDFSKMQSSAELRVIDFCVAQAPSNSVCSHFFQNNRQLSRNRTIIGNGIAYPQQVRWV